MQTRVGSRSGESICSLATVCFGLPVGRLPCGPGRRTLVGGWLSQLFSVPPKPGKPIYRTTNINISNFFAMF